MFSILIIACIAIMLAYILSKTGVITVLPFYVLALVIFILLILATQQPIWSWIP